jgi:peptide deformylase
MIYPTVAYGDPILKKVAKEIEVNTDIKGVVANMFETMYEARGLGLAAPQVNRSIRLFIIDTSEAEDEESRKMKRAFINPEIIEESEEEWAFEEGCLSIPDIHSDIIRPESIVLRYYDEDWNLKEERFDGINGRVILHEFDHLEGVLFTDYIQGLKKRMMKKKLLNISKGKISARYKMKFPV